jgi:rubrerythrin
VTGTDKVKEEQMTDVNKVQEAIRNSLATERGAMQFYQLSAREMKDPEAKRVFTVLAEEERSHAESFFRIYQGGDIPSFADYMAAQPDNAQVWIAALQRLVAGGFSEKQALELAMTNEQNLEKSLRIAAAQVSDPAVREVFEQNARETNNHYQLIESEYARLMGMVHESDVDTFVRE